MSPVNIATDETYAKPLRQIDCPSLSLPMLSVRMLWRQGRRLRPAETWIETRFSELIRGAAKAP